MNKGLYKELYSWLDGACQKLAFNPALETTFRQCFLNTLETTVAAQDENGVFIITGDIPAMWLRDSSVQVSHYVQLCAYDEDLKSLVRGIIKRQLYYIRQDPYANAFNQAFNGNGEKDVVPQSPIVWERKYETDSLIYPLWLINQFYAFSKDITIFDEDFYDTLAIIISTLKTEQRHDELSTYRFIRAGIADPQVRARNTLANNGKGSPTAYTGLTWSACRSSDDTCQYHYHIPQNQFAYTVLRQLSVTIKEHALSAELDNLASEIKSGIDKYGVVRHGEFGRIYAYETDGFNNYNLMDDANTPSLLSLPYLGFCDVSDEIYQNTRKFVLSESNPYYFEGKYARGIGSPHTPKGYVWHISMIMQALTSDNTAEIYEIIKTLLATDGGTGFMHESFSVDDSGSYTRPWFAWANTLFAVLIMRHLDELKNKL